MPKIHASPARPLLDPDAPDRFKPDVTLIRQITEWLESLPPSTPVRFLPETSEQHDQCPDRKEIVATVILASGMFDLVGFRVGKKGMKWDAQPEVVGFVRPYVYLSHLLHIDSDVVRLLFGPMNMNDMMMLQFDPTPPTDLGMIIFRLKRFLREGEAVCRL